MATAMRSIVMLLVLVGLPSAWVYYGPLPPRAQQVVDRVVEIAQDALGTRQQTERAEATISAPRYQTTAEQATPESTAPQSIALQVQPLLERLRSLGVSEYTLEKWGNAGQLYRFRCAMPLAQSDDITRQFEAVADSPLLSVEQVVVEVATWHASRQTQNQF